MSTSQERTDATLSLPDVVTREEWLAARLALLAKEKAATKARDELNAERRRLPMVEIDKDYVKLPVHQIEKHLAA